VVVVCDIPTSSRIDWRIYCTEEELRALKSKHINLLEYPNHEDISHIGLTVCDIAQWMMKRIQELGMKL
jgi:hypothetical protein